MPRNKCYYHALELKDGTIVLAYQIPKPRNTKSCRAPKADEDGICYRAPQNLGDFRGFTDLAKGTWATALTTQLNMKRLLRSQIGPRLDRIESLLSRIAEKMEITSGGNASCAF